MKRIALYQVVSFLLLSFAMGAQTIDHGAWDMLLRKYVNDNGMVNYKGISTEKDKLVTYLNAMAKVDVQSYPSQEQKAYWINLYNAATVKLIVDNLPLKSITDLDGGKVWDRKMVQTKSTTLSLNNIEHDILRKKFNDPRIHAAVNCASKSCPPLMNRAFTGTGLEKELDSVTRFWINNPKYNVVSSKSIQISKIFDWYSTDFGNIVDFFNKYSDMKVDKTAKISYLNYDWTLNAQ